MQSGNPMQSPARVKCSGRKKRTKEPCGAWAVSGSDKCRMHGGKGSGRPVTRGRYADVFRGDIRAAYENSLADPRLMDLSETLAALDALVRTLAVRLQNGDTPEFRAEAVSKVDAMIAARGAPDGEAGKKFQELVVFLRAGADQAATESVLFDRLERLTKRVEEANKILHAKQNAIPAERITDLLTILITAVKANAEEKAAARIVADLERAFGDLSAGNRLLDLARRN